MFNFLRNSFCLLIVLALLGSTGQAREIQGLPGKTNSSGKTAAGCQSASAFTELNVNNIRAGLMTGGDLWWDLSDAKYEVPKVEPGSGEVSVSSIFAGALWIGGIDQLGQLKIAAQTYRQTGNDFWAGPLDDDGQVDERTCNEFDRFWEVSGTDITNFLAAWEEETAATLSPAAVPQSLQEWPARNNVNAAIELPDDKDLAPFYDYDENGIYDPTRGDYPVIDPENEGVYADQMIWWVFNDKGDIHSETGGEAIGVEVGALAFAYATNDEVNNMSFYKYVVDNRSTAALDSVYFGQWVDPDLGEYDDDYVGCNVENSLGVVYNGQANDGQYGSEPPMLGVDFFQGPRDENGNELGMSAFVYYDNDRTDFGNPDAASHFYGYLAGHWKNGRPLVNDGVDGRGDGEPFPYVFPGDPADPEAWSECSAGNTAADRRFLQVSGPFRLLPGAVNEVIVGVVWVQEGVNYPCPSFKPLLKADAKAQALFDSNFAIPNGPDAPDMVINESDRKLILTLSNSPASNNFNEEYMESDAVLAGQGERDSTYNFQGYILYQLKDSKVSSAEYRDVDKARILSVVDVKDGVNKIVNWDLDADAGFLSPQLMVSSPDQGIRHTFEVTTDLFATGDTKLKNNTRYYYSVVAYGYNAFAAYNPDDPSLGGQQIPYLEGRRNIGVYVGIPHRNAAENGGTTLQSDYGDSPDVKQIQGYGSGGNELQLTDETIAEILANGSSDNLVYKGGSAPIDVKVYDPSKIPAETFRVEISNSTIASFESTSQEGGKVELMPDGTFKYTPPSGFEGIDQFLYFVSDEFGNTDPGNVVIEVGDITGIVKACDDTAIAEPSNNPSVTVGRVEISVTTNDYGVDTLARIDTESPGSTNAAFTEIFSGNTKIQYKPNVAAVDELDRLHYFSDPNDKIRAACWINVTFNEVDAVDDVIAVEKDGSITFDPKENDIGISNASAPDGWVTPYSSWTIYSVSNPDRELNHVVSLIKENEEAIGGWSYDGGDEPLGFTVKLRQPFSPRIADGYISDIITFEEGKPRWMVGMADGEATSHLNWIRSGDLAGTEFNDYPHDRNAYYENIAGGTIAPYCLTAFNPGPPSTADAPPTVVAAPACRTCEPGGVPKNNLDELACVRIVLSDNPEDWSQCVVVEMARDAAIAEGQARRNSLRNAASVNLDGTRSSSETGRSWFPGYAINTETGKRLNVMFGENSFIGSDNGKDMIWNPTDTDIIEFGFGVSQNRFKWAGEHYLYVMNTEYDNGARYHEMLGQDDDDLMTEVYREAMWVMAPQLEQGFTMKSWEEGLVPSDMTIDINVASPYRQNPIGEKLIYEFSFDELAAITGTSADMDDPLEAVQAVPNPYYAYSDYENNQLDNRIKITNLPERCTVRILQLDGTMIRQLKVDNSAVIGGTSYGGRVGTEIVNTLEWDLKNERNVPIAGGMYLIQIEAPDLGVSKTIKWFAVVRPVDLDRF